MSKLRRQIYKLVVDCLTTGEAERTAEKVEYGNPHYWVDEFLQLFEDTIKRAMPKKASKREREGDGMREIYPGIILHIKTGEAFTICPKTKDYENKKKLPKCIDYGHSRYYPTRYMYEK